MAVVFPTPRKPVMILVGMGWGWVAMIFLQYERVVLVWRLHANWTGRHKGKTPLGFGERSATERILPGPARL